MKLHCGTMNNYTYSAEAIKSQVTMQDAIALYAPSPAPRHSRIPCPVHGGTNYNLGFTDRLYHCFVCGSGGDVISFTQHVFGLDFPAALDKLNTDFRCGIPLDRRMTLRERREANRKLSEITSRRELEEAERQLHEALYNLLWDEWTRLDQNRYLYAPKSQDEEFHPLFIEALKNISEIEFMIDTQL